MKEIVKSDSLIPFLNKKNNVDLKFRNDATIERKEVFINKVESIDESEGTVWATITTQDTDRTGDIVIANGVDTSEFKKIPSVYKNHNYADDAIGTCEEMVYKDDCILAKVKFTPLTVQIVKDTWEKVKAGTMRGVSIGFDATNVVLKGTKAFDEITKGLNLSKQALDKTYRIIKNWTLYEFSIVSLPANASCTTKQLEIAEPEVKQEVTEVKEVTKENVAEVVKDIVKEVVAEEVKPEVKAETKEEVREKVKEKKIIEVKSKDGWKTFKELEDLDIKDIKFINDAVSKTNNEEAFKAIVTEPKVTTTTITKVGDISETVIKEEPIEIIPHVKRYIQVIQTPEETNEFIQKSIEARLRGKTRIVIVGQ